MLPLSLVFHLLCLFALSLGIPAWNGRTNRDSINSLVPGSGFIEALGLKREATPNYLSVLSPARGIPGDAVIAKNPSPPHFFINHGQLWQVTNETSILAVNLHNTTTITGSRADRAPFKLALSDRSEGVTGGSWRWQGTRLFYERGPVSNEGLFYSCPNESGIPGVYMNMNGAPPSALCQPVALHGFSARK